MGRFCAQHALDGIVDVTTIPTAPTTTATNTTTIGRSNCAKVGGSTRMLDGVGDGGEPEPSVEEVAGGAAADRGSRAESAKPSARKQSPRGLVDLEQDADGKEPIAGWRKTRRKLDDDDAGATPT